MGVRVASVWTNVQQNAMPAGNATSILFQLPPLIPASDGALVICAFTLCWTVGSSTTYVDLALGRGTTISGQLLGLNTWSAVITVGNQVIYSGFYEDQPPPGSIQYWFGIAQNPGASAGTFVDGCLIAFVL